MKGYPDYPVNPGFASFRPLTITDSSELVRADGVNGNFVGFRSDAVRSVGLPDADRFPHYGDGVYTIRFSRAGYKVLVCTKARADLEFELERRLSPFWRVAVNRGGLLKWINYYFFSPRSLYHVVNRYRQTKFLHGEWRAPAKTLLLNLSLSCQILVGVVVRSIFKVSHTREKCIQSLQHKWPTAKLRSELEALDPQT